MQVANSEKKRVLYAPISKFSSRKSLRSTKTPNRPESALQRGHKTRSLSEFFRGPHGVSSPFRGRSEAHRSTASTSGSLRAIQVSIMARVRPSFSRRCGLPAFLARRRGVSMVSARPAGARRGPKFASSEDDSAARSSPCAGSRVGEAPASSSGGAGARCPQCLCACVVRGLSGSTGRRRVSA